METNEKLVLEQNYYAMMTKLLNLLWQRMPIHWLLSCLEKENRSQVCSSLVARLLADNGSEKGTSVSFLGAARLHFRD